MFYFVTFVYDTCYNTCYGIAGIMNVTKRQIGVVMWILFIVDGTVFNAIVCAELIVQQQRDL
jgi:hypothetical protein